jgi:glycosyltransferase involved in cell wall biosynthesis
MWCFTKRFTTVISIGLTCCIEDSDLPTELLASMQATTTSSTKSWPRIALVTPVFNSGRYIEHTIRSVLAQGYPNLEYFIVDGGSTDGTIEVIRKYEGAISGWMSESDNGMYDAINKGFARTRGEIMGWISATDQLHLGGLLVVGGVFRDVAEAEWITGRPTWFNEEGMNLGVGAAAHWSRTRFLMGANRYIQQESTFWRRSLWERAGGRVDASRRNAADFELWVRFFRHAQLYPVDAIIGGFRKHGDSLGLQDLEACHRIHDEIIEAELEKENWGQWLRRFRRLSRGMEAKPQARGLWRQVMNRLYHQRGRDWAPLIVYDGDKWRAVT